MNEILGQLRKADEKINSLLAFQTASEQEKVDALNAWTAIFHTALEMADTKEKLDELTLLTPPESFARDFCLDKLAEL